MSTFDYRMNRRQQLIKRGEPMDNNIDFSGKTNTDFLNTFVAKMKDTNNLYTRESPGQFTDPEADIVRRNLIIQNDGLGEFNDQSKQIKSDAFIQKFQNSRMLTPDEKRRVSAEGVREYLLEQPNSQLAGRFPTDGVKVS